MKKNTSRKSQVQNAYTKSLLSPIGPRKLSETAKSKIEKLFVLAKKGDLEAARELYSTAAFAVEILEWLCKKRLQLCKDIAREKFGWPIWYNPHRERREETDALLRELELGKNTQINLSSGKTFSHQVPANIVALNLHRLAQNLRRAPMSSWTHRELSSIGRCGIGRTKHGHRIDANYWKQMEALEAWGQRGAGKLLPPLSKQTARQWATPAKELFKIAYPGDFEEHPHLRKLRASVLGRAKDAYGHTGRGVIRKAMLQAMKQAWHSIAALD